MLLITLTSFVSGQGVVYPLHVGDRWQLGMFYPTTDLMSLMIVRDTLMPNLKTYAVFNFFRPQFQRFDGERVYAFLPDRNDETVVYDFTKNIGDTVGFFTMAPDTFDVVFTGSSGGIVDGRSIRGWTFAQIARHMTDADVSVTILDSIGLYHWNTDWGPYYFYGASIDGRVYGSLTTVPIAQIQVPVLASLGQSYPNPFNGRAIVPFTVSQTSEVVLDLHDMLGRKVADVVRAVYQPGKYSIPVDASTLPSGVYVCRLRAGSNTHSIRMILAR